MEKKNVGLTARAGGKILEILMGGVVIVLII